MKVKINNYQIIEDAELEFPVGITSIVGSTNNGKSSIIRAIKGAINNQGGSSFINYNSDEAVVSIDFDSNSIKWTKSKKAGKSNYIINEDRYDKIGQTQLKEVADIMNMPEISVGNERYQINFWKQLDKPFLVDKSPYQLFDFIAKSKEQEQVDGLKQQTEEELKVVKRQVEDNYLLIDNYKKELTELIKEDEVYQKLAKFNPSTIKSAKTLVESVNGAFDRLNSIRDYVIKYGKVLQDTKDSIDNIELLLKEFETYNTLREKVSTTFSKLNSIEDRIEELRVRTFDNSVEFYEDKAEKIYNLTLQYKEHFGLIESVKDLINKFDNKSTSHELLQKRYQATVNELNSCIEELSQFKTCPLCGLRLDTGGEHGLH